MLCTCECCSLADQTCVCCSVYIHLSAAGLSQLSSAVATGRLAVEGREAELREEINAALRKMRAYARDMEVRRGPGMMHAPCCTF